MTLRYASVVLDVDSTVSAIEGIDWLAQRRSGDTAARIMALTDQAMRGEIPLESVYGMRLAEIKPSRGDLDALARAYIAGIATGCHAAINRMREAGVKVILLSGGIRQAILPLAEHLGIADADLHAVDVYFDDAGKYLSYEELSPLATSGGKPRVVELLNLPRPIIGVGDGSTDLAMKGTVDTFAAFTGFASRDPVVRGADIVVPSFDELSRIVLGSDDKPPNS